MNILLQFKNRLYLRHTRNHYFFIVFSKLKYRGPRSKNTFREEGVFWLIYFLSKKHRIVFVVLF